MVDGHKMNTVVMVEAGISCKTDVWGSWLSFGCNMILGRKGTDGLI